MTKNFLHQWNRLSVGLFVLLLVGVAYAVIASQTGHSPGEIEDDVIYVTTVCDNAAGNPSDPDYRYKFCQATCPSGPTDYYYAIGGSCKTLPDPNTLTYSIETGARYNLTGALSDAQSWNCFNANLTEGTNDYIEATAVCAKTGGWTALGAQTCGDYKIQGSEVCDGTNFGDWLDCTDFQDAGGNPLCNGTLKCDMDGGNSCGGFDVSSCAYCGGFTGTCDPPNMLCNDDTCQSDCSGNGGTKPPVGTEGESCLPGQPCGPLIGGGAGLCGNGVQDPGEICDGSGCAGTTFILCPDKHQAQLNSTCIACDCVQDPNPCGCVPACESDADCGLLGLGVCVFSCCVDTGV